MASAALVGRRQAARQRGHLAGLAMQTAPGQEREARNRQGLIMRRALTAQASSGWQSASAEHGSS